MEQRAGSGTSIILMKAAAEMGFRPGLETVQCYLFIGGSELLRKCGIGNGCSSGSSQNTRLQSSLSSARRMCFPLGTMAFLNAQSGCSSLAVCLRTAGVIRFEIA